MRNALVLVVVVLLAAPALAGDGDVPQGTLSSLGLGDMQSVSDAEGMQVRGRYSWFASVKATSLIFGQLLTPDTKNFEVASSVNEVDAEEEHTRSGAELGVFKMHGVGLDLNLDVGDYSGSIYSNNPLGVGAFGFGGVANYFFGFGS